jgi:hypothetical protein
VVAASEPDDALLTWAEDVAAAIRAGLSRAAADPVTARRLTLPASGRRGGDTDGYAAMVGDLSARLLRGAPPLADPERTARNVVVRVARQVLLQLETHPDEPVTEIAPDLIIFALTPYVGLRTARCLADRSEQGG